MRKMWIVTVMLLTVVMVVVGCSTNNKVAVTSGSRTVCSFCNRVITEDVQSLQVAENKAEDYRVSVTKELCQNCVSSAIVWVSEFMRAYNNQDEAGVLCAFSEDSGKVAQEIARKSTGEYWRRILREGPGCGEFFKNEARRELANRFEYPLGQVQCCTVPLEDMPDYVPSSEDKKKVLAVVKVSAPSFQLMITTRSLRDQRVESQRVESFSFYFLLLKEGEKWKIRTINTGRV